MFSLLFFSSRCSDPDKVTVNFFGGNHQKKNAGAYSGIMYHYFGGNTMSFKKMEMHIKPKGAFRKQRKSLAIQLNFFRLDDYVPVYPAPTYYEMPTTFGMKYQ